MTGALFRTLCKRIGDKEEFLDWANDVAGLMFDTDEKGEWEDGPMASEFESVNTQGMDRARGTSREIILSLAGPRGGTVTTQSLSVEQAKDLMDRVYGKDLRDLVRSKNQNG